MGSPSRWARNETGPSDSSAKRGCPSRRRSRNSSWGTAGLPIPDVRKTLFAYAGLLNPLIKGPLEQAFDTQFFTGRRLSDLHPTGAGSAFGALDGDAAQLLSQFLANTPATRFVSTLDRLADPRKGSLTKALNLGTGFKLTDVDVNKSRAIDVRRALEEAMRHDPKIARFMEFYVRPEDYQDVKKSRPETLELMRLFTQMKNEARKKAEAKRKAGR
jgi:hypothetical protein